MGEVYLATDTSLHRSIALKVLPPELVSDPVRRALLLREARLAAAITHPHIATIYEVIEHEGALMLAMEYVEGHSLRAILAAGPLSLRRALHLGEQAAEALAAAHRRGVVHRDVKPENIMLAADGHTKVLDFGCAHPLAAPRQAAGLPSSVTTLTRPGEVPGTPAYMAPEQVQGRPALPESDVFALGATVYEAVTGRRPFAGTTTGEVMASILRDPPPLPSALRPDLPPELDRILLRTLAKEPAERYRDARDLAADLRDLRARLETGSASWSTPGAVPLPAPRKRRTAAAVAGGFVLLGASVLAWWLARERPADGVRVAAARLRLLLATDGAASDPEISSDGTMIALVTEADGSPDLFVMRTAGGARLRLTHDPQVERTPTFSPDGDRIAFARRDGSAKGGDDVWLVPTLGGPATLAVRGATSPAWSPDGSRLAFVRPGPGGGVTIAVGSADGADERELVRSDAEHPFLRHPAWSPDGREIAFGRGRGGVAEEVWLVPAEGGAPRRLVEDPAGVFSRNPVFTPDGRGVIHVSNRGGAENLWIARTDGGAREGGAGALERLTTGAGPDDAPSVSRGGRVAFINQRSRSVLIAVDLDSGRTLELLRHSGLLWAPTFSPDARSIAFSLGEEDGSWHVWMIPAKGGEARQITHGLVPELYPRFTPDGSSILYHTWTPQADRVLSIHIGGGGPETVTPVRAQDDAYADVSPDGRFIAFTRIEEGIDRIVSRPREGGPERLVHPGPATLPRFSPDGAWIAFAPDRGYEGGILVVRTDGTAERRLTATGGWPVWTRDGASVAFLAVDSEGDVTIRLAPMSGGEVRAFDVVSYVGTNHLFDFSPDGRSLVTTNVIPTGSEIWLLESE